MTCLKDSGSLKSISEQGCRLLHIIALSLYHQYICKYIKNMADKEKMDYTFSLI